MSTPGTNVTSLLKDRKFIAALFVVILVLAFYFDLPSYFSFEGLRENEAALRSFASNNLVLSVATYILAYVVVVTFLCPELCGLRLAEVLFLGRYGADFMPSLGRLWALYAYFYWRDILSGIAYATVMAPN